MTALVLSASTSSALPQINVDENGFVIKGYDPVAYFTDSKPVIGLDEFTYEWNGVKWRFASEEHRRMFIDNPSKYAPQYGGY